MTVVLLLATVLALPFAFVTAFSHVAWFDDEGTLMIWFRSLQEGHRMYDEIYCLYGPLWSGFYGLVYGTLHVPLTHTAGRLLAVGFWLGFTALFAMFCYEVTRSRAWSVVAYVVVLCWLFQLMNSPGHPEELGLLLTGLILVLACVFGRTGHWAPLAAIGAATAGLVLVKINFGAFVGAGVLLLIARSSGPSLLARVAFASVSAGLILLPLAIQAALFRLDWVPSYCVFTTGAIVAGLMVLAGTPREYRVRRVHVWAFAAGVLLMTVVVVGGMMVAGSSADALLNAVLLQNFGYAKNWQIPFRIGTPGLLAVGLSLLAALLYLSVGARPALRHYRERVVLLMKAGSVLGGLLALGRPDLELRIMLPFCWLLMALPPGAPAATLFPRQLAGVIGLTMALYPFPVAGHQVSIAALIALLSLPVYAHDILTSPGLGRRVSSVATGIACAAALVFAGVRTIDAGIAYAQMAPLNLPGTAFIRVDHAQAESLRWATAQLSVCKASYTLPNQPSFAFWTGHTVPTPVNINGVLNFATVRQQQAIVDALAAEPDLCVLKTPALLTFFDRGQVATDPPLLDYLTAEFREVASRDGFVILKRRAAQ